MYCECADHGEFWLIFFDAYGQRVSQPLKESADPDWNEYAAVQAAFGPLVKVPHDALQRLYDKRGKPQLPPMPGASHTHETGPDIPL